MEITLRKSDSTLVIRMAGRLDASWSSTVQEEFNAAVRQGEHHIALDLSAVDYISSAGLGVLLSLYKELHAIKGQFGICAASPFVASTLKLAGLASFLVPLEEKSSVTSSQAREAQSARAIYEIFSLPSAGFQLSIVGDPDSISSGGDVSAPRIFGKNSFALGLGALGSEAGGCEDRLGEFLAVAGSAVFQPVDGANRPDFVVHTQDFLPEGRLLLGLVGEGDFSILARFETTAEYRTVGLAELAATALKISGASAVAITALVETAGLVGTAIRQSPAQRNEESRFEFPQIRDWLAFSNERIFPDATALLTGVVANEGTGFQPLLRPLGGNTGLVGHFHAATFPYRPIQKGQLELEPSVTALFANNPVQAVLHLLHDDREITGIGESEFLRGALWITPIAESESPPQPPQPPQSEIRNSKSAIV